MHLLYNNNITYVLCISPSGWLIFNFPHHHGVPPHRCNYYFVNFTKFKTTILRSVTCAEVVSYYIEYIYYRNICIKYNTYITEIYVLNIIHILQKYMY